MEVNVDVPQGFDMDEDNTHEYNPDMERFEDEEEDIPMQRRQQPIYYEMPEYSKPQQNETGGGLINNINPLVWMVIVFVAFILGFFMGMGSGGKGGSHAPIILAPRGNM